jgi:hypothetical protein
MMPSAAGLPVRYVLAVTVLLLAGCGAPESGKSASPPTAAPAPPTAPGSTYESLAALPDWSGAWSATIRPTAPVNDLLQHEPSPLKPAALSQMRKALTAARAGLDPGDIRRAYCRPFAFGGLTAGIEERVEFLFTPGRVTITTESGLIRRIYTDGRKLPAEVEASNAGTSVGHWEGRALVVETVGLNPEANIYSVRTAPTVGSNARTTERIFLREDGALEVDTMLEAPDVLLQPLPFNMVYRHIGDLPMAEYSACPKYDRAIDPANGNQRFDMTPPSDLPPPPK